MGKDKTTRVTVRLYVANYVEHLKILLYYLPKIYLHMYIHVNMCIYCTIFTVEATKCGYLPDFCSVLSNASVKTRQ